MYRSYNHSSLSNCCLPYFSKCNELIPLNLNKQWQLLIYFQPDCLSTFKRYHDSMPSYSISSLHTRTPCISSLPPSPPPPRLRWGTVPRNMWTWWPLARWSRSRTLRPRWRRLRRRRGRRRCQSGMKLNSWRGQGRASTWSGGGPGCVKRIIMGPIVVGT